MADDPSWMFHNSPKAPPRQPKPGELLFEFYVEHTHTFWRCELRDHGSYGVEAQFLDPIDIRIARTFNERMDVVRTPRQMAIAWAHEERRAIESSADEV